MSTIEVIRKPSIERAFREALSDPRSRGPIAEALGWDDSQVSRFLSGNLGVPINKIDAGLNALELRVVSREYLDGLISSHTELEYLRRVIPCSRQWLHGSEGAGRLPVVTVNRCTLMLRVHVDR